MKHKEGPFNVVLMSFDTLRRDHVHVYGHEKDLTPNLDKLASEGVIFTDAVVNCGWTLPQHATLVTGLSPLRHGAIFLGGKIDYSEKKGVKNPRGIPSRVLTLAEIFRHNGYLTFGFGNRNAYAGGWEYGFHRGMFHYTTIFPYNNIMEEVVGHINDCLRMVKNTPFYMYIHTNDTHEPFSASEPFGSKWGTSYKNKYEGEVSYVDHYFGIIIKELKRLGLDDKTLIVATSDHGSEFQEHGFLEKKLNLYEEISRIPIIMKLPAVLPSGKKIKGLCQTVDIPPTILDICSIKIPDKMDGISLLPRIYEKKGSKVPETVFAHTLHEIDYRYEQFSARNVRYKFVRTVPFAKKPEKMKGNIGARFARLSRIAELKNGIWRELYDLVADPMEKKNVIRKKRDIAEVLEKKLDNWIKSCGYKPRRSGMKN